MPSPTVLVSLFFCCGRAKATIRQVKAKHLKMNGKLKKHILKVQISIIKCVVVTSIEA
jgi:hypothetical protein